MWNAGVPVRKSQTLLSGKQIYYIPVHIILQSSIPQQRELFVNVGKFTNILTVLLGHVGISYIFLTCLQTATGWEIKWATPNSLHHTRTSSGKFSGLHRLTPLKCPDVSLEGQESVVWAHHTAWTVRLIVMLLINAATPLRDLTVSRVGYVTTKNQAIGNRNRYLSDKIMTL
jgi:hypothetical protein